DAPVNAVPAAQTIDEDMPLVFSGATGISISDVDGGAGVEKMTGGVVHGTLTLGSSAGLTTVSGDGTATVTATGTLSTLNSALSGLTYRPAANYNGGDTLT